MAAKISASAADDRFESSWEAGRIVTDHLLRSREGRRASPRASPPSPVSPPNPRDRLRIGPEHYTGRLADWMQVSGEKDVFLGGLHPKARSGE